MILDWSNFGWSFTEQFTNMNFTKSPKMVHISQNYKKTILHLFYVDGGWCRLSQRIPSKDFQKQFLTSKPSKINQRKGDFNKSVIFKVNLAKTCHSTSFYIELVNQSQDFDSLHYKMTENASYYIYITFQHANDLSEHIPSVPNFVER